MRFPALIDRSFAVLKTRPWSFVGAAAVMAVGIASVQGLNVEPRLAPGAVAVAAANPPYHHEVDARSAVADAQARAAASGKMLMVAFGANWCPDCLTLHENLLDPETHAYAERHFEMLAIDVGDQAKSAAVKRELGFDVKVIPAVVFYAPDGMLVGDTLSGELQPSRHFTSRDIRGFLREVVDYHRVVSPDQRQ